ncbi:sulfatase family protein [Lignipirellula cremea]|uniref:Arylsulfatase n=1 Tax=Lignipirellula cremea TaxID=2528010 RepID=A0A518DSQ5_9BACT|nr:sulfatase [Lignipirellula cremea]QDU94864.1 Arylsulfatase [Lignipirellula cremea]
MIRSLLMFLFLLLAAPCLRMLPAAERPNIVFLLSDDHRHDFLGFHPQAPDFLETPHLDQLAKEGVHLRNAFVSTSLCSPSRASILTGLYMHHHQVVDNQRPVREGVSFFPQHLQQAGYETAFVGKWHMGHDSDERRPGFDYWASFKGQGVYFNPTINVNGDRREIPGYNADVLTDLAIEWLKQRQSDQPFLLYLSFKAVHYPFQPAPRHRGRYADKKIPYPETMANTERNYRTQPRWVKARRYSIHGVDHMQTTPFDNDPVPDFDDFYRSYCETVHSLDENVGRVMAHLREQGLAEKTIVFYMGDNGFHLGEHGFYDKRDAYETSIRVPLLAWAPGRLAPGTTLEAMVQNIDIAPTLLQAAGVEPPAATRFDGASFWPLLQGKKIAWRDHLLYEYHWEWNFPATPTLLAIRTERYKYVYHYGVWDSDALFDLQTDPIERHNLIDVPALAPIAEKLRQQLFAELAESRGLDLPLRPPLGERLDQRKLPD